jgi:uroporphyrin-III C-methyltransferase/precorrin-2 dehydrogenase/sirohydrochlorin ferrochelatase
MAPQMFPLFLKLEGRKVLLVGGGRVAALKLDGLLAAGARVTVVAPTLLPSIEQREVTWVRRGFEPADVDGAWLVIAAAPGEVNRQVARAAEDRQILVNAVDDPASGSAYTGAVIRRAGVTFAISTEGESPALAGLLREALDTLLPAELAEWVAEGRAARAKWKEQGVQMERRRPLLLEALNRLYAGSR